MAACGARSALQVRRALRATKERPTAPPRDPTGGLWRLLPARPWGTTPRRAVLCVLRTMMTSVYCVSSWGGWGAVWCAAAAGRKSAALLRGGRQLGRSRPRPQCAVRAPKRPFDESGGEQTSWGDPGVLSGALCWGVAGGALQKGGTRAGRSVNKAVLIGARLTERLRAAAAAHRGDKRARRANRARGGGDWHSPCRRGRGNSRWVGSLFLTSKGQAARVFHEA